MTPLGGYLQEQKDFVDASVLYWGLIKTRKISIYLYFLPSKIIEKKEGQFNL